jgi:hypothetical protein
VGHNIGWYLEHIKYIYARRETDATPIGYDDDASSQLFCPDLWMQILAKDWRENIFFGDKDCFVVFSETVLAQLSGFHSHIFKAWLMLDKK